MKKLDKNTIKKWAKKPSTWIKIGSALLVCGVGVGGGIFAYKMFFSFQAVDYSQMNATDFEDNQEVLMKKYQAGQSLTTYKNNFEDSELVNIALNNKQNQPNFSSVQVGIVHAAFNVEQSIRSCTVKESPGNYFMENISRSSFVAVAKRFYGDDSNTKVYAGKCIDTAVGEYSNFTEMNNSDFEEAWGKMISRPSIYIISSKTVLNSDSQIIDGELVVNLSLHPTYSVLRYVKQMVSVSDLAVPPTFTSVDLEFHINQDMLITKTIMNDVYSVTSFGINSSNTREEIVEKTFYGNETFPSVNENYNYDR